MKFGITSRLFFAIALTNIAIAAAAMLAMYLSFSYGFLDYLKEREADRLETLATVLGTQYQQAGSWAFIAGDEDRWVELNRVYVRGGLPTDPTQRSRSTLGSAGRTNDGAGAVDDAGLVANAGPGSTVASASDAGITSVLPARLPPIEGGGPRGLDLAASTLLDADKHVVVGARAAAGQALLRPIIVGERTVGWLSGTILRGPLTGADERFESHQREAAAGILMLGIALAALSAWLMARGFVAPIKRLAGATHALASGRYTTRVAPAATNELGQLVDDFNRLAATLERNEQLRRHWMADISHELRTPLAILRGELEAIEDGIRPLSPATLASLQMEVTALSKLVDDLHEVSLTEVGAMTLHREPVDLAQLVAATVHAFERRFASRGIGISLAGSASPATPLLVYADAARITQVLNNLLENCVRYTDAAGHVVVTARHEGEHMRVDVEDSGPGVPPDALPRLFERLYRVEASRNRASGGAGIGLALCRGLIDAHGGDIQAAPSAMGGLRITFRLPGVAE
jgi:two-component system sensor histidine kinase BaeS